MGLSVARRWEMCKCAIIQYPSLIPRPRGCKVWILAEVTAKYLLYWPKIQPILLTRKISVRAISGVLRQLSLPSDREALSNYLSYYSDSYFAYPVPLRTDSLAVRRTNPDKYYLVDTGMIGALKAKNDAEKGFLLENAVFMELRRGFNKIEYFVTKKGEEVDFFVTDKVTKEMRLGEVSYEMPKGQTREREISALRNARTETCIRKCEIVTWDEEGEEDGIRIVPAWKWFIAK